MNITHRLQLVVIVLFASSISAQAADDHHCIGKQLQAHQQAEQRLLHGFASGSHEEAYNAAVDLVASETYLSVCGFPGDDPRIHGALNSDGHVTTPEAFAAAVFHKRLFELTGFRPDVNKALTNVDWDKVDGVSP